MVNECEMWGRSDNALMPLRVQSPALPTHLFHYYYHYLAYSSYAVCGNTNKFQCLISSAFCMINNSSSVLGHCLMSDGKSLSKSV